MKPEVTLTISDEFGDTQEVPVQSKRFTIGRTPDNDLAIANASLSRRHAVIETFEGVIQITDCGSQNGTEVNGTQVVAGTVLHHGDLITLGGVCDITVTIVDNGKPVSQGGVERSSRPEPRQPVTSGPRSANATPSPRTRTKVPASGSGTSWLGGWGIPLIAATAVALVVVIAGGLLLFLFRQGGQQLRPTDRSQTVNQSNNQDLPVQSTTADNRTLSSEELNSRGNDSTEGVEQVEKAAIAVMQRISSDDKPYSFSEKALLDIGRKVGSYRGSSALAGYLESIQRNSSALGAMARQEGLEPGLLIYAVLAQTDGGKINAEPLAVARGILSSLLAVRATFGTTDAESSLILLAAYKMGGGGKRSHPLLATIRRLVKHPLTQRNVWYLNERGGLEAEVYDFVVSFLALAVIAQNPAQFGVAANPLVF
jgi:pSer/pThr/pTyr-binding forkhead associated (FHA) protein